MTCATPQQRSRVRAALEGMRRAERALENARVDLDAATRPLGAATGGAGRADTSALRAAAGRIGDEIHELAQLRAALYHKHGLGNT